MRGGEKVYPRTWEQLKIAFAVPEAQEYADLKAISGLHSDMIRILQNNQYVTIGYAGRTTTTIEEDSGRFIWDLKLFNKKPTIYLGGIYDA